jgi:flagellar biosynthetic protein FliR
MAYFFAVDAHLAVVGGIAFSVSSIPLGSSWFMRSPELLIRPVAAMFSLAIVVIAPVLFILLLVELAVMVAARVLPQMNVFFVATPAKTAVGLGALALSGSFMAPVAARAYADIFRFWTEVSR